MYMHLFGYMQATPIPALPCLCASLRRTSRALTQHYEEALRPLGLRASQFTILQVLSLAGEMTQGEMGQFLVMNSTTLTRTLAIMSRHGWITRRRGEDRREWWIRLSSTGSAQLGRALPHWEKVQALVRKKLGRNRWDELMQFSNALTEAVTQQDNRPRLESADDSG
jgi:DNA-binding MarR family transcriptional regulator